MASQLLPLMIASALMILAGLSKRRLERRPKPVRLRIRRRT